MRTTRQRIHFGLRWNALGALVNQGSGFLLLYLAVRYEGKEALGAFGIVQNTIAAVAAVITAGGALTATKFLSQYAKSDRARASRYLTMPFTICGLFGVLAATVLITFGEAIAGTVLRAPELEVLLTASGVWCLLSIVSVVQVGSLMGLEAFRAVAVCNIIFGGTRLIGVWIALGGGAGILGMVYGLTAATGVQVLVQGATMWKNARAQGLQLSFSGWSQELPQLLQFGAPAMLASFVMGPTVWACNAILVRGSGGLADMAIVALALQWQMAVRFVPTRLLDASLPVLSALSGEGRLEEFWTTFKINLRDVSWASGVIGLTICVFSSQILQLYGIPSLRAAVIISLFVMSAVLHMMLRVYTQAFIAQGDTLRDLRFSILRSGILLLIFVLLSPYGALGLAFATCASYLILIAVAATTLNRNVG